MTLTLRILQTVTRWKLFFFFLFCWTQHNNTTSRTHADILFWCCLVYCAAWTRRLIRLSWTAGPARLRLSWTLIIFNLSDNLSWITLNKDQLHQSARSSYWLIFLSQLKLTVTLIAFTRTLMCFCECVFCVCWFVSKKNYKTRSEFWFRSRMKGRTVFSLVDVAIMFGSR